jgi:hypothetical protein
VPVMIVALCAFWLLGGTTSSAGATFAHYVDAWEQGDPKAATGLFVSPPGEAALQAQWIKDSAVVAVTVQRLATQHPEWNLDQEHPYANLRFEYAGDPPASTAPQAVLQLQIVRIATVPSTFLGIFPTTTSETQVVAVVGEATLVRLLAGLPLPFQDAAIWLIQSVTVSG